MKIQLDTDLKTIKILEPVPLALLVDFVTETLGDTHIEEYTIVPENWKEPDQIGSITTTPHPPLTWTGTTAPWLVTDAPISGTITTTEAVIFNNKIGTINETN